jgi:protein TonB
MGAAGRVTEQTAGSTASQAASAQDTRVAQAGERQKTDETPLEAGPAIVGSPQKATAAKAAPGSPGSVNIRGAEQQQEAHRLRPRVENPVDPLRAYVKTLTKRLEAKLVYPEAGRQAGLHGWPTVTFTILADGALDPNSLKLVSSSGSPKLDQSALETVRASAPFAPPPREITLKLTLIYGR